MIKNEPKRHNVVLVGAGALGSHVLLFARNWNALITVVDFDRVETKNTQAQFHTKGSLRKNKAQAISQALNGLFGRKLRPVPHKLSADNSNQLIPVETDLVIDCTDNLDARETISAACRAFDTPCLHGCLSDTGDFARIVWEEMFTPDAEEPGQATCEDGEMLPFFAIAGGLIAMVAQQFLEDGKKVNLQATPFGVVRF